MDTRERHITYLYGKGYGSWIEDLPMDELSQYVTMELHKALGN